MKNEQLSQYIKSMSTQGADSSHIKQSLLQAGWSEDDINIAMQEASSPTVRPMPVPPPPTAWDQVGINHISRIGIFVQLFSFVLLAFSATSLGALMFQIINKYLPDALQSYDFYSLGFSTSVVHYSIAVLIVTFPLYFLAMRYWFGIFKDDNVSELKGNKFLAYLVLFVTSATIVGDLITVIYTFLEGEITSRFALKALSILVITALIFGFYFIERRKIQYKKAINRNLLYLIGAVSILLALVSLVFGFIAGGSPFRERLVKFDLEKVNDLGQISGAINQYAFYEVKLPKSLDDLKSNTRYSTYLYNVNQKNFDTYEYRVLSQSQYELCANFNLSTLNDYSLNGPVRDLVGTSWNKHDKGRTCNKFDVTLRNNNTYPPLKY